MVLRICVEQTSNHPLILRVVPLGFVLKEFDTTLAKRERYLYPVITKGQVLGTRQKVGYDFNFSEGLVGVFYFRVHRVAFLFAKNLRQRSG